MIETLNYDVVIEFELKVEIRFLELDVDIGLMSKVVRISLSSEGSRV